MVITFPTSKIIITEKKEIQKTFKYITISCPQWLINSKTREPIFSLIKFNPNIFHNNASIIEKITSFIIQ